MIPDEDPPLAKGSVYGDNSGSMLEDARAAQREALDDTPRAGEKTFAQRRADFLKSAAAQAVRDRDTARDAADTVKLANDVWKLILSDRQQRTDPFRQVHSELTAMALEFWAPVEEAMAGLRGQIDAWTEQEDQRIRDQELETERAMKRMREAAKPKPSGRPLVDYTAPAPQPQRVAPAMQPARRAKIRGDLGSILSQTENVIYEIEDLSKIPDYIMQSPTVTAAILAVVKAGARHLGVPAGIRTRTETGNQIR